MNLHSLWRTKMCTEYQKVCECQIWRLVCFSLWSVSLWFNWKFCQFYRKLFLFGCLCFLLLNEKKGYTEIFVYLFQKIILVFIFFRDATIVPFWADTDTMLQIMLILMFFVVVYFLLLLLFIPLFCATKKSSKLFDHTNSWNNLKKNLLSREKDSFLKTFFK